MPSIALQATKGFRSPGGAGSSTEWAWKRKYLRRAGAVPVVKTLWVHKAAVVQFNALCLYLQRNGARLGQRVDDWGFANRDIRGYAGVKSYHAFGLAIDVDATENPMGTRRTTLARNAKEREEVRQVCKRLGLRWGYDYKGRPDPMHFEMYVSRVRARYIRSRLLKNTKRSRRLAKLCDMTTRDFIARIDNLERYGP